MPYMEIEKGVNLYYEDKGEGKPVIFIHGVWMTSRFFHKQIPYFSENYRTIAVDLRSHGKSPDVSYGNTVATYAQDLNVFIDKLGLKDVTLDGWSMGAFVIWEYLHQFGGSNLKATVIVDELASDFKWPDFEIGAFDLHSLAGMMQGIQTDQEGLLRGFLPLMFKEDLSEEELAWMLEETMKIPSSIAGAILFDQSVIDCRPYLSEIDVPTLLCFGREEKLIPVAAGEHLHQEIKGSTLEIFEESCHCPFLEEPERFNQVVDAFIQSLELH
ncbi:alpha/beta fold hydrolase [Thalassobacillus hwangdonensis]|uniref:Alpha/beta fold hydrolase n=1 Tax=Thalassobacillus hwangdonensis TaxID=546108 RepID=A0ABW3L3X2_9BACI